MASYIVTDETQLGGTVAVPPGSMSIGRAPDNDLSIPHTTVSAHHARIVTYFDVSYIEDLDSTNGTFLNGKRIERHTLHEGDEIRLGGYTLRFRKLQEEASAAETAKQGQAVG